MSYRAISFLASNVFQSILYEGNKIFMCEWSLSMVAIRWTESSEAQHLCHKPTLAHNFITASTPTKEEEGIDAIQRRLRDKMSNSRATHPTPTANDVQLGRGGHNWASAGNEQLRLFALGRVQDYAAATKKQKALISR